MSGLGVGEYPPDIRTPQDWGDYGLIETISAVSNQLFLLFKWQ